MKIVSARLRAYALRLPAGVGGAGALQWRRAGLLLRLVDDRARVGQGEAAPLPGYSPEGLPECAVELERALAGALPRVDLTAPLGPQLEDWWARAGVRSPAARCALETALLDLVGQRRGCSLAALLAAEAGSGLRDQVALAALLRADRVKEAVRVARERVGQGIRVLKLKLGRPGALELELDCARAVREAVGPGVALRFDANQAFRGRRLERCLTVLAELGPELVEEPAADGLCDRGMEGLRGCARVPLAADESLRQIGALQAMAGLMARGQLRALVLKPMALGGLLACLGWARRAEAAGLAVVVTHLWEGPIGLEAARALGRAIPGELLACGLSDHPGVSAWRRAPASEPSMASRSASRSGAPPAVLRWDQVAELGPLRPSAGLGLPLIEPP